MWREDEYDGDDNDGDDDNSIQLGFNVHIQSQML